MKIIKLIEDLKMTKYKIFEEKSVEAENHGIIYPDHQESMAFLPFYGNWDSDSFSWDVLYILIGTDLYDAIAKVENEKGMLLPENFYSYVGKLEDGTGPCFGVSNNVDYELITKCVYAEDLKRFNGHQDMAHCYKNLAAWAYLQHCPDDLKIALYWH